MTMMIKIKIIIMLHFIRNIFLLFYLLFTFIIIMIVLSTVIEGTNGLCNVVFMG